MVGPGFVVLPETSPWLERSEIRRVGSGWQRIGSLSEVSLVCLAQTSAGSIVAIQYWPKININEMNAPSSFVQVHTSNPPALSR